jgi:transposase
VLHRVAGVGWENIGVAKSYRPVQRDQQFLLAPDMREWLEPDHLVWLVLEVVEQLDTSGFHRRRVRRRTAGSVVGRRGYDPDMLLALLVYAYCTGERSSRRIEAKCHTDVAFRVVCAQDVPDHTVIARFRREFCDVFADLFSQVLGVCARAGLVKVGLVAVDGTKIEANAALAASKTEAWLREQAGRIVAEAEAVDAGEDRDDDANREDPQVRAMLADRERRARAISEALASIEAERRADPQTRDALARLDRAVVIEARVTGKATATWQARQVRIAAGQRPRGRVPHVPDENPLVVRARASVAKRRERLARILGEGRVWRRNLTDPDSRAMKTRTGFCQGYNAQVVAAQDHVIVAVDVFDNPTDIELYVPMISAAQAELDRLAAAGHERVIGTVLADAGYFSTPNLEAPGPDRIIAFGKKHDLNKAPDPTAQAGESGSALDAMRTRFGDEATRATYRRRAGTVEPINAHLKDRRGLRRFSMRGIDRARGELNLAAAVTNLMRYATLTGLATT